MDAAFEFSFNGLNMEFAINLAADGHSVPDFLFVDIMTEKMSTPSPAYQIIEGLFNVSCQHRS